MFLEYVPNFICAKKMYNKCPSVDDLCVHCEQCEKYAHMFWQEPVRKLFIIYGCANHSQISFMLFYTTLRHDAHFVPRRFLGLRWVPQLKMNGAEILNMSGELEIFGFIEFHHDELI